MLTKLDMYDYSMGPGVIWIKLNKTNDPILVDIMSDIHNSSGKIYLDDRYYEYKNEHNIIKRNNDVYLELHVVQINSL